MSMFHEIARRHYLAISDAASAALTVVLKVTLRERLEADDADLFRRAIGELEGFLGAPVKFSMVVTIRGRSHDLSFEGHARDDGNSKSAALRDVEERSQLLRYLVREKTRAYFYDVMRAVSDWISLGGDQSVAPDAFFYGTRSRDLYALRDYLYGLHNEANAKISEAILREGSP